MKCFFCGEKCSDNNSVKDNISSSFTNYNIIANPGSECICDECLWSIQTAILAL